MKNLATLVAVIAFAGGTLTVAAAHAGDDRHTETVQFTNLNATDAKGAAALYGRVVQAARNVCSELDVNSSAIAAMRYSGCWHTAAKHALTTINLPALTAYAVARGTLPADSAIQIARRN